MEENQLGSRVTVKAIAMQTLLVSLFLDSGSPHTLAAFESLISFASQS